MSQRLSKRDKKRIEAKARDVLLDVWEYAGKPNKGTFSSFSPSVVAAALGLKFQPVDDLGHDKDSLGKFRVAGVLLRDERKVLVVKGPSQAEIKFTAMHEIAHWILHPDAVMHRERPISDSQTVDRDRQELEADYFASCLLMPEKMLKRELKARFGRTPVMLDLEMRYSLGLDALNPKHPSWAEGLVHELAIAKCTMFRGNHFASLSEHFGASPKALALRLRDLDLVAAGETCTQANPPEAVRKTLLPASQLLLAKLGATHSARMVVLQHALRDTAEFLRDAKSAGFVVGAFVAKPNSIRQHIISDINALEIPVIREPEGTDPPYSHFEGTDTLHKLLADEAALAKSFKQKLVLIDVGGYFGVPLLEASTETLESIAGVVEVTTFGFERYKKIAPNLAVPVVSIARSELKQAEAIYVGQSAIRALEDILHGAGKTTSGRTYGVVGYGMIAREVALTLQQRHNNPVVTDIRFVPQALARLRGHHTGSLKDVLTTADIVLASTGTRSVTVDDLRAARDGILLASVGSRTQEFDVDSIREIAKDVQQPFPHLTAYRMPWGKTVYVANEGKAINFLKDATPEEVIDLVFAGITESMAMLLAGEAKTGCVNELIDDREEVAARTWGECQRNARKLVMNAQEEPRSHNAPFAEAIEEIEAE